MTVIQVEIDAERSLKIDLFAPGMTTLHRVGLAGLAMTLSALEEDGTAEQLQPSGSWKVTARDVTFQWQGDEKAFFSRLIRASFRVTDDGLIWFPGLGHPLDHPENAGVLHSAILNTFLQHPRTRKSAKRLSPRSWKLMTNRSSSAICRFPRTRTRTPPISSR